MSKGSRPTKEYSFSRGSWVLAATLGILTIVGAIASLILERNIL